MINQEKHDKENSNTNKRILWICINILDKIVQTDDKGNSKNKTTSKDNWLNNNKQCKKKKNSTDLYKSTSDL